MTVVSSRGCRALKIGRRYCRPRTGDERSPPCSAPNPAHRADPGARALLGLAQGLLRRRGGHRPGDGPEEAGHLRRDRGRCDRFRFPRRHQMPIALAHPELPLPGSVAHRLRQLQAPPISTRRARPRPALGVPPRRRLAPLDCSEGVRPRQAIRCRGPAKRVKSPTPATTVTATMNPTPRIA
jgi:hypothetical protein